MVMISYYSRVREQLKIDYDSFMIIQTAVSHSLYQLNKKKIGSKSYIELETEWEKLMDKNDLSAKVENVQENIENYYNTKNNSKLTISSICLVTSLPKETVRRKVNELIKKNLLNISKRDGVLLGSAYKKVFREFTPSTTKEISRLIKNWENSGILKSLLNLTI
jgi:Glu-tRNA(Gln) amidotransferase subunit E-like FAD-binding protein